MRSLRALLVSVADSSSRSFCCSFTLVYIYLLVEGRHDVFGSLVHVLLSKNVLLCLDKPAESRMFLRHIMIVAHRHSIAKRGGCFQRRLIVCGCVCLST